MRVTAKTDVMSKATKRFFSLLVLSVAIVLIWASSVFAQSVRVGSILVDGNRRIETATIVSYAGLERGAVVSQAQLNDAAQNIRNSGQFSDVSVSVRGGAILVSVVELPTVNQVVFEGNRKINDGELGQVVRTAPRRVFSTSQVEADANAIAQTYANEGRISASVIPRIIERPDNRVDVVFEVIETAVVEIERVSFVGNRNFSDRRLRRIIETKQAGLLRIFVKKDTFIEDRIRFDRQVLADFYNSRGYVDFQVLDVNAELSKKRDAFLITFRVREGQQYSFGQVGIVSEMDGVDSEQFAKAMRLKQGQTYSPIDIEDTISRIETQAARAGIDFMRVEPRVTRNDVDLELDIEFVLSKGPRVFVERIDIEGNATTLDRVIRRQFDVVEGDPFNPRKIRAAAERIRALDYFENVDVNAREGGNPDQVVIDVDLREKPTGSFTFGANYNVADSVSGTVSFKERNFLGRGQTFDFGLIAGRDKQRLNFNFIEPALLGRDVGFGLNLAYQQTDNSNARYDTRTLSITPSLSFPISENGRLSVNAFNRQTELFGLNTDSEIITEEAGRGKQNVFGLGYKYTYNNRRGGFDPATVFKFSFGQDFGLLGTDRFVTTEVSFGAQTKVFKDEITLIGTIDTGAISGLEGGYQSLITDRYFLGSGIFRGFEPGGIGPREYNETTGVDDALGGNLYAVARLEAQFPIGLPDEYGISGGAFVDVGSLWGLDSATLAHADGEILYEGFTPRATAGVSLFWRTPIGPLRFNFSRPINKETFDREQNFDLTISTAF